MADPQVVSCLNELLLHWARRDSYGLPVGNNASRILAEAALVDIDAHLRSIGANFIRFVDDYRFFAGDAATAQFWLYQLMHRLAIDGHTLNGLKTQVRAASIPVATSAVAGGTAATASPVPPRGFVPRIGYGRVPRRFVPPKVEDLPGLVALSATDLIRGLADQHVIDPEAFSGALKVVVAKKEWTELQRAAQLLRACPPFIDYFCDLLLQNAEEIPAAVCSAISNELAGFMFNAGGSLPESHQVNILKVLGTKHYASKVALMRQIRSMPRDAGAYVGRSSFDALVSLAECGLLTRTDAIDIRGYFDRADMWEKRAIIRIVRTVLGDEEYRAWERYARPQVGADPFSKHLLRPFKAPAPPATAVGGVPPPPSPEA